LKPLRQPDKREILSKERQSCVLRLAFFFDRSNISIKTQKI